MKIIEVDIREIRIGDTVEHLGNIRTVGRNDLKDTGFMGYQLFNDSYNLGINKVKKVIYPKWYKGERVN